MDEGDKREVEKICWKTIFIAVVLVGIGVVIGRVTAGMCPLSPMGKCGGGYSNSMKSCWNKGGTAGKCWLASKCGTAKKSWGKKAWPECGKNIGKCKPGCMCPKCCQKAGVCQPGCTCPKCSKKAACLSDPNKVGCPMMQKKTAELEKE